MDEHGFRDRREALLGIAIFFLIVLSLILQKGLLLLMAGLLWLTRSFSRMWGEHSLTRVDYHRRFERSRLFVGEEVALTVEVVNRKVLPVPELAVDDEVPQELEIRGRRTRFLRLGAGVLRHLFSLAWYQRVTRRYTVVAARRGCYRIGPAILRSGDPFGFVEKQRQVSETADLIVYPTIFSLEQVGIPSRRPFGDLKSRDRIFEDPSRFAGVRDYRPGDPLNRVHWKASAAAGSLQTKIFDPSVNAGLVIFANAWSFDHAWHGTDGSSFERGFSVAGSIVSWAVTEDIACGLYVNGIAVGWGKLLRLPPSRGEGVLEHALEGLARVQPIGSVPIHAMIEEELPTLSYGTSVVIITRSVSDDLAASVARVQRSGRPVTLVLTAGRSAGRLPHLPGVRVYEVPGEEALSGALLA